MNPVPNAQLSHVGIHVRDLGVMVAFYERYLGMVVSDTGPANNRHYAFMSRNPGEHHQLVLATGRTGAPDVMVLNQLSFRIDSLEDLQRYYSLLSEEQAVGLEARNHGNSWSVYFFDPEGNKIELYVPTRWYMRQPWKAPLDLSEPAASIVAQTEKLVMESGAGKPVADWSLEMRARLNR